MCNSFSNILCNWHASEFRGQHLRNNATSACDLPGNGIMEGPVLLRPHTHTQRKIRESGLDDPMHRETRSRELQ